jgi:hypothetical protein
MRLDRLLLRLEAGNGSAGLLLDASLHPNAPAVVGIDETLERRRGKKIRAKGLYRVPVYGFILERNVAP